MTLEEDCEQLQEMTITLERDLSEFLVNKEVPYLTRWAYEMAHQQCEALNIKPNEVEYKYMQSVAKYEVFKRVHNRVFKFIANTKEDFDEIEITLPSYEEIPGMIQKAAKRGRRNRK